ncbi:LexA-binding, inner membrane-associated putative hydrolase [uncultured archaeon]|nr:LexA-binding, inner membrane-associated putative hydrolase [uncultured archaeon]
MMGRTHMAFGFLAGMLTYPLLGANWMLFLPLAVLGSLVPDVDSENSKINRMLPITRWIPKFFQHRGFFHSLFAVAILYILFYAANLKTIGLPIAIGYAAHLASDCLTQNGCNLLHPISNFRISGFVRTDGAMELLVMGAAIFADALLVVKHFL